MMPRAIAPPLGADVGSPLERDVAIADHFTGTKLLNRANKRRAHRIRFGFASGPIRRFR